MTEAVALSDIGCARTNNEDLYALVPDQDLYIVSDGIGGAPAGEVAAQLAVNAVETYIRNSDSRDGLALVAAFNSAHRCVASAAVGSDRQGMGCTLVAALVNGTTLFLANAGDSRAYVFKDGACRFVTSDQTWANEVGRQTLGISDLELRQHPYRHVLTVAVGVSNDFRVNSYALPIVPGMQVLLCTDGLHDIVSDADITDIMISNRTLASKCQSLIAAAKAAGGADNITVVVLNFARCCNDRP